MQTRQVLCDCSVGCSDIVLIWSSSYIDAMLMLMLYLSMLGVATGVRVILSDIGRELGRTVAIIVHRGPHSRVELLPRLFQNVGAATRQLVQTKGSKRRMTFQGPTRHALQTR